MMLRDREVSLRDAIEGAFVAKTKPAVVSLYRMDNKEVFSGTLLLHHERLFVITCDHPLYDFSIDEVRVVGDDRHSTSDRLPGVMRPHRPGKTGLDIALLELDRSVLSGYLKGYQPITADDFGSIDYTKPFHRTPALVGNAVENVCCVESGGHYLVQVAIEWLPHELVVPSDWPAPLGSERPNNESVDLYAKTIREGCNSSEASRFYYREPYGLSGGGYWVHDVEAGSLWRADAIKMVGVQATWHQKGGYLHGTQIGPVLDLLNEAAG